MDSPRPYVYETPRSQTTQAILLFLGGIALFILLFILMALMVLAESKSKKSSSAPPIAPIVLGIFGASLIGTALLKISHSQRVAVTRDGMHIDGAFATQYVRWSDIRHLRRAKVQSAMGQSSMDTLELFDTSGRLITRIGGKIAQFQELQALLGSIIGQIQPTPPDARWIGNATRRVSRGTRLFMYLVGIPIGLGFLAGGIFGTREWMKNRALVADGVVVSAHIERLWMRSITPYVEYTFADSAGQSHRRESMMNELDWTLLHENPNVEVRYLPADPEWNRLEHGSAESEFGLPMSLLLFGLSALFLGSISLIALGWDLKSENGQTLLTRHGVKVRSWGKVKEVAAPSPPAPVALVTLPDQMSLPYRRPPGLILLGVGIITLGTAILIMHIIGLVACCAIAMHMVPMLDIYADRKEFTIDFAIQSVGVLAGLLGIIGGVAVLRTATYGWWLGVIALLAIALSAATRLYLQVSTMAELPDMPGEAGMNILAGLILGVLLDVIMLAATVVILCILTRRRVRQNWRAAAAQ